MTTGFMVLPPVKHLLPAIQNLKQNQLQFNKGDYIKEYSPYRTVSEINLIPQRMIPLYNTQKHQEYVESLLNERRINTMQSTKTIGETYF